MDNRLTRRCVIRWIAHLVQTCPTHDADMVADVLGINSGGHLRSIAMQIIRELAERGQ